MVAAARRTLHAGITTVRDLGDRSYLATRVAARAGDEPMPTIVAAGPPITTPGGHCHFLGVSASGADELRASVRDHVDRGVGVIKVMASGGQVTEGSDPTVAQYSAAEMRALVDEAHRHGLPVVAHAHSAAAIAHAVAAGVDGIEHCTFMTSDGVHADQEVIDAIARQRIVVGATVGRLPGFAAPPHLATMLDAIRANFRRLREAGVSVLAGTDRGTCAVQASRHPPVRHRTAHGARPDERRGSAREHGRRRPSHRSRRSQGSDRSGLRRRPPPRGGRPPRRPGSPSSCRRSLEGWPPGRVNRDHVPSSKQHGCPHRARSCRFGSHQLPRPTAPAAGGCTAALLWHGRFTAGRPPATVLPDRRTVRRVR